MGKSQSGQVRKIALRLMIAVCSFLTTILALEVALRLFFPYLPVDIAYAIRHVRVTPFSKMRLTDYVNAPVAPLDGMWARWLVGEDEDYDLYPKADIRNLVFELTPNVRFTINTYRWTEADPRIGFRTPPPENGQLDIVALGDSMTFCYTDIEACWTTLLEEQLGHSVANLGIIGTGAISHANIYTNLVRPYYKPKIVLWQFLFNDPVEDVRHRSRLDFVPSRPITPWLHDHSVTYSLLKHFIQTFGKTPISQQMPASDLDALVLISDGKVTIGVNPEWASSWDDERLAKGMALGKQAILETRAAVEREGGVFVLLLFPDMVELYYHIFRQAAVSDPDAALALRAAVRQEMRAFCAQEGLLCLDLHEALAKHVDEQLIFVDDYHFNARGNQLVAAIIADFLRQSGLVQVRQE
ncbi:MAG: GDSL-type esterase/lipase family protein [Anaerolineae bacterium]|nr:GDSL-type esterase/lipase family protein [Anaerolineae bacterium]